MVNQEKRIVRCAIYTRKSTDENLNSDFTSLDAQRESCEAYIKSQQAEGWELYPERYDDAGYTGGNMDRPALQQLLRDARDSKFEMIAMYKIDRFTRSLRDFTRIVDVLDSGGVSFVAVTQHFNTSTSMGRLILNILLSFAQFEREIISERTRDKRAATAKKGKWLGGYPVLGYNVNFDKKTLVPNKREVPIVKFMFKVYLETQSSIKAAHAMNAKGYRTKEWVTKKGLKKGGAKFNKSNLRKYLKNPVYLGKIKYKDKLFEGEHPAIIDKRTFDKVQALLNKNGIQHKSDNKDKHGFPLRGLLRCSCCESIMTPHFSYSKGRKYFYYRCTKVNHMDRTACSIRVAPARETEKLVLERLQVLGKNGKLLAKIIEKAKVETLDSLPPLRHELNAQKGLLRKIEGDASNLLNALTSSEGNTKNNKFILNRLDELEEKGRIIEQRIQELRLSIEKLEAQSISAEVIRQNFILFNEVFEELKIHEQRELLQLLIKEVLYDADHSKIKITMRPLPDIEPLVVDAKGDSCDVVSSMLPSCASFRFRRKGTEPEVYFRILYVTPVYASSSDALTEQTVEIALGPKGAFKNGNIGTITRRVRSDRIVSAVPSRYRNRKPPKQPKTPSVKLLLQEALEWNMQLETGEVASQAEIASREKVTRARVTQIMKLLQLSPEIQDHILSMPESVRQPIVTERALRPIVLIEDYKKQMVAFGELSCRESVPIA